MARSRSRSHWVIPDGRSGPSPACISQPLSVTRETGAWPQGASFLGTRNKWPGSCVLVGNGNRPGPRSVGASIECRWRLRRAVRGQAAADGPAGHAAAPTAVQPDELETNTPEASNGKSQATPETLGGEVEAALGTPDEQVPLGTPDEQVPPGTATVADDGDPEHAYKAVSAGGSHSCAVAADDTITCWGDNNSGLADVPAGAHKAVSAGSYHSCAIATDGAIVCWGDDDFGALESPSGTYVAVSAGVAHNCSALRVSVG